MVLGVAHARPTTTVLPAFPVITLTLQHGPASSALPSVQPVLVPHSVYLVLLVTTCRIRQQELAKPVMLRKHIVFLAFTILPTHSSALNVVWDSISIQVLVLAVAAIVSPVVHLPPA